MHPEQISELIKPGYATEDVVVDDWELVAEDEVDLDIVYEVAELGSEAVDTTDEVWPFVTEDE